MRLSVCTQDTLNIAGGTDLKARMQHWKKDKILPFRSVMPLFASTTSNVN